jgi:hypothetical protein
VKGTYQSIVRHFTVHNKQVRDSVARAAAL